MQLQQVQWSLQTKQRRIRQVRAGFILQNSYLFIQVMRSQERKIEEQRTFIAYLRQQPEKKTHPNEKTVKSLPFKTLI